MDAITYSSARANLARTMDRVCEDHEPFVERANLLSRPLRTRTVGGAGAPASSRCLPDWASGVQRIRSCHATTACAKKPTVNDSVRPQGTAKV